MTNPLLAKLTPTALPHFDLIRPQHIISAITKILEANRVSMGRVLSNCQQPTWENFIAPLEDIDDRLNHVWSITNHLYMVTNSPKLREVYQKCLPMVTAYYIELGQNKFFFERVLAITKNPGYKKLDSAQKKVLSNMLRDFKLAGVALDKKKQQQFATLQKQLSKLQTKFSDNVLDATNAWEKLITDPELLSGLSENILVAAKANAESKKLSGWLITLRAPFLDAVLMHADNSDLRKEMYLAYITRASFLGNKKLDNTKIILAILEARQKIATLLGFKNYAELSLATKMAPNTKTVFKFLIDLAKRSRKKALGEFAELKAFARNIHSIKAIEPWDVCYYSEKLRVENYAVSEDEVRKYFPCATVVYGLFKLIKKLYSIEFKEINRFAKWHKDVRCFKLVDKNNVTIGKIYLDLYTRSNKQGGAWMDSCRVRRKLQSGKIQLPVAYLNCNFAPPVGSKETFLSLCEVETLFHELGHCLQHLLTTVDYAPVSGINGVPWDAVELASQFMEEWCLEKEVLAEITCHEQTKKPMPIAVLKKILQAKNMQSGLQMLRQLEFALFDFRLHTELNPKVQDILDDVRNKITVVPISKSNRFQNSFQHIFGGGYAAGYYSYKWAEVLACDAFANFKEHGIFNKKIAQAFLTNILMSGGAVDPMVAFKKFRGRGPKIDELLKQAGII